MTRITTTGLCLATIALAAGFVSCGTCNPRPTITSITPNRAPVGGDQFLLTITGNNFLPSSRVIWNGSFLLATFVSSQQLTASIPASNLASPGTVIVVVFNPSASSTVFFGFNSNDGCGGNSNGVSFNIML